LSFLYLFMFVKFLAETSTSSLFFGFVLSGVTGVMILQYAQYIFCWESSFINFYFLQTTADNFIASKMQFLYTLMAANFVVVAPLSFLSDQSAFELLALTTVASLFHVGITIPIIIYIGFYQENKIDLEKSVMFNYEGTSWAAFAIVFLAVLPFGILYTVLILVMDINSIAICLFVISVVAVLNAGKIRGILASRLRRSAKYDLIDNFTRSN